MIDEKKLNIFIGDSVLEVQNNYYHLMDKTKKLFFKYLIDGGDIADFAKEAEKIWENVDHTFMQDRLKEFEEIIEKRNLRGRPIINPNATFEEIYKLNPESKFYDIEIKYLEDIITEYGGDYKTLSKDFIDKNEYLSKQVKIFDKMQNTVPYFRKDGTISYHSIASYLSMLYNVNLTRTGWNRTFYDAELLDNDLMYLVAHPFACPLCINAQGRIYSKSGKSKKYPSVESAMNGEYGFIGHPNCRHQWTIYWGEEQIQEDKFNNEEWNEKYKTKQKVLALQRKYEKIDNDRYIYMELNNYGEVDKTAGQLNRIEEEIKELKKYL